MGAFFPQIRALFSNFRKRAWETSSPSASSHAPAITLTFEFDPDDQDFFFSFCESSESLLRFFVSAKDYNALSRISWAFATSSSFFHPQ